jgi:DNA-binding NtrC family response regulator
MQKTIHILHIDDDPFAHDRLVADLKSSGTQVQILATYSASIPHALTQSDRQFELIICDYDLGSTGCIQKPAFDDLRSSFPTAQIIAVTSFQDPHTLITLLNLGFDRVICKQDSPTILATLIQSIVDSTSSTATGTKLAFGGKTIESIQQRVTRLLNSAVTAIHIYGESGTGKEVVADLIAAQLAPRQPFVRVNCAAISPDLLHAELFGFVKGAFTGAAQSKRGLIEAASGGFLFLDEVALLSPDAQAALLRVLESGELRRVGSDESLKLNLRIVSATNEPLSALVESGRFRRDLWQRLAQVEMQLPPLRQRREEIPAIIQSMMAAEDLLQFRMTDATIRLLSSLEWREGNVRELRNCLRAMTEFHHDYWLLPSSIPRRFIDQSSDPAVAQQTASCKPTIPIDSQEIIRLEFSQEMVTSFDTLCNLALLRYLEKLTSRSGPLSLRKLATQLGMSRAALTQKLRDLCHQKVTTPAHIQTLTGANLAR